MWTKSKSKSLTYRAPTFNLSSSCILLRVNGFLHCNTAFSPCDRNVFQIRSVNQAHPNQNSQTGDKSPVYFVDNTALLTWGEAKIISYCLCVLCGIFRLHFGRSNFNQFIATNWLPLVVSGGYISCSVLSLWSIYMQKPGINAGCRDKSGTFGTWAEYTEMVSKARYMHHLGFYTYISFLESINVLKIILTVLKPSSSHHD